MHGKETAMNKKGILTIVALFLMISFPGVSLGVVMMPDPVAFSGSGSWGSFSGNLYYTAFGDDYADIRIELTNTSPSDNSGFLTGLAFLLPDPSMSVSSSDYWSDNSNFSFLSNPSAGPYGSYSVGVTTGSSWEGSGQPSQGIGVGQTVTFNFGISGNNLSNFTGESFTNLNNFAVVRFTGFTNEASDMVVPGPGGGGAAVPEPATILLLGSGLLGLAGLRKKFKK